MAGIAVKGTRFQYAKPTQLMMIGVLARAAGFNGVDDPEFLVILKRIAKVDSTSQLTPFKAYKVIEILKGRI